jgi:maltose O-acetyltransferase
LRARILCQKMNSMSPPDFEHHKKSLIADLFGYPSNVVITPPFHCDYGYNIALGENVYFNFNCIVLDVVKVSIGNNVLFGPGVQLLTATHPIHHIERSTGLESGREIRIGNNVWVGAGALICPGVSIGNHSVIGAGSVVTKHVPENVVAAGNPCKILKRLD